MAYDQNENTSDVSTRVKLADVFFTTLKHWPWILLSVIICVGAALFYVLRTEPIYTRSAAILIKDDSNGMGSSAPDGFSDMGFIKTNSNIIDEVNKLQSPDIMEEAVKRLNLDMTYSVPGRFHDEILYGTSLPIAVTFPDITEGESASATIDVDKQGRYTISGLIRNDAEATVATKGPVALGDTTRTSLGPVVVSASPYLKKGHAYTIDIKRIPLTTAVGIFASELGVARKSKDGNTIVISATDKSTQRAEDLINAVISVYNEKWVENRNQVSVATSNFINERLGVIENELGHVDQDISSYQSEHLIPDVQQAASMYMSENQTTSAQILDLSNQLQMSRYMRSYLTNDAHRGTVLPANSGIGNASIESQIAEYNDAMIRRNQYAANSSDTHPVVMDLDAQLAGMRSAIISTIDNQIVALETQIRNLQSSKNRTTAQIAANPNQAKYLLSVERQQKVKESLYLFLLQKREENELSQAFTAYNTQIITHPTGSNAPIAPRGGRILLIAFAIGLLIPFGVTYVKESTNDLIRGRKDIESLTIPFLGEIPATKPQKGEPVEGKIVVKQGKRDMVNEAFRVFRTNIGFMRSNPDRGEAIMITSFNPGSGKTFLMVNLGISLALKGQKVLVIDGDMRRCSTSAYVNSPSKGLSDYLVGKVDDINAVIVADSITPGLSVLPVGTVPPNPTELLETPRFAELIERMKHEYDYVLIDCPPFEMIADAQIIEQLVDRTVFVIRAGVLERAMLPVLQKLYNEKRFKNMGIILNGTVASGSRYGSRYGYGYGYGNYGNYGGYGSDKK